MEQCQLTLECQHKELPRFGLVVFFYLFIWSSNKYVCCDCETVAPNHCDILGQLTTKGYLPLDKIIFLQGKCFSIQAEVYLEWSEGAGTMGGGGGHMALPSRFSVHRSKNEASKALPLGRLF